MLYDSVAGMEATVDGYDLSLHESETSSGFTRTTTEVALHGDGETGRGEDVTYDSELHYSLHDNDDRFPMEGSYTFDELSRLLEETEFFRGEEPGQKVFRSYRRWAFESAALDLALRQTDTDLASQLGRSYDPVRFVVSTRLEEPPTGERVLEWLRRNPELEFKLDPTSSWTADTVETLSMTESVRVLDLKGQYEGTEVDQSADPELYELVVDGFPDAVIEDPELTEYTREVFEGERHRVSWDYPITGVESVESLPWQPSWLNIKPSRFGSIESLFDTVEHCWNNGIEMYGGGQFELSVGRGQIQALASLFYPDTPNDVAPMEYNQPETREGLPASPLNPPGDVSGFRWS